MLSFEGFNLRKQKEVRWVKSGLKQCKSLRQRFLKFETKLCVCLLKSHLDFDRALAERFTETGTVTFRELRASWHWSRCVSKTLPTLLCKSQHCATNNRI
ncbi:hypothetical protein X975_14934, partial [Stegodyphus mimosarum]